MQCRANCQLTGHSTCVAPALTPLRTVHAVRIALWLFKGTTFREGLCLCTSSSTISSLVCDLPLPPRNLGGS